MKNYKLRVTFEIDYPNAEVEDPVYFFEESYCVDNIIWWLNDQVTENYCFGCNYATVEVLAPPTLEEK